MRAFINSVGNEIAFVFRFFGRLLLALIIILIVLILLPPVFFLVSYLDTEPAQDRCPLGSATSAEYQQLLSKAMLQKWAVWPGLSKGLFWQSEDWFSHPSSAYKQKVESALLNSIQELIPTGSTPDVQLAAVHAVMRSMGASYFTTVVLPERYASTRPRSTTIQFLYTIPQWRFSPYCVFCYPFHTTEILVNFDHFSHLNFTSLGRVVVLFANLKSNPLPMSIKQTCPSASDIEALNRGRP